MTTLDIDGVQVVFEGLARLRWSTSTAARRAPSEEPSAAVLDHVWPRRDECSSIRRQIAHGRRTVVVIVDPIPALTLSRRRVPLVPFGAVEIDGAPTDMCRLQIPLFGWLSDRDRVRGEEFLARTADRQRQTGRLGDKSVTVERELLGTAEPLRFLFSRQEPGFGRLRSAMVQMFAAPPAADPRMQPTARVPAHIAGAAA